MTLLLQTLARRWGLINGERNITSANRDGAP